MRPFLPSIIAASLGLVSSARAAEFPVVAVFDIEDQTGTVPAKDREQLTSYLASQMAEGDVFRVLPRAQLKAALAAQKSDSYQSCYDEACQIEIGKELAAEKSLLTQILRIGDQCVVSATLYDLRSAASEVSGNQRGTCALGALLESLESVISRVKRPKGVQVVEAAPSQAPQLAPLPQDAPCPPGQRPLASEICGTPTRTESYRGWVIGADLLALGVSVSAVGASSKELFAFGALGSFLGAPLLHLGFGEGPSALGSFGIRAAIVGLGIGLAAGLDDKTSSPLTAAASVLLASTIDAAFLAYPEVPAPLESASAAETSSFALVPWAAPDGESAGLGLAGRF